MPIIQYYLVCAYCRAQGSGHLSIWLTSMLTMTIHFVLVVLPSRHNALTFTCSINHPRIARHYKLLLQNQLPSDILRWMQFRWTIAKLNLVIHNVQRIIQYNCYCLQWRIQEFEKGISISTSPSLPLPFLHFLSLSLEVGPLKSI